MQRVLTVAFCLAIVVCVSVGWAEMIGSWSTPVTYGPYDAGWSTTLTFNQFDPGTDWVLTGVEWEWTGDVDGSAQYENLSTEQSGTVTCTLTATIASTVPGGAIWQVIPLVSDVDTVTVYDGTTDYDGPSGKTINNLSNQAINTGIDRTAGTLAAFTGSGTVGLSTSSLAYSNVSGTGTFTSIFDTNAAISARIRYRYDYIPEPATAGLMLVGLVGLAVSKRRRDG